MSSAPLRLSHLCTLTPLTLGCPGITFVVDAGRAKQKLLQPGAAVAQYDVRWCSKASAAQRAGRAGRTGPGHCYRCACPLVQCLCSVL